MGQGGQHQPAGVGRVSGAGARHPTKISQGAQPAFTEDFGGPGVRRLTEYPQHPALGVGDR